MTMKRSHHQSNSKSQSKVQLGKTLITASALEKLARQDVHQALLRHARGVTAAMATGPRTIGHRTRTYDSSVYHDTNGVKFWIITEADRSVSTVLLPEDY